eukprot:TRINITY_DN2341_c0_g3_i9.p1 TRINITY_DN2341_c0_g3~~TRINITY_DN2341_c0_g3_i9.p1  ORF type:complete len:283 (+),score=28.50 TRINITY_DN2341_c0_g3_i9:122-970(+)
MGSFIGHSAPGSFFFLYGLICWLTSLTEVKALNFLRTTPLGLSLRGIVIIFGATFTMGMEISDMIMTPTVEAALAHSHTEHLFIDCIIFLIGLLDLLVLYRVIWSSFYPILEAILWTFVGLFFTAHAQDNLLGVWMHQLNVIIVLLCGVFWLGVVYIAFGATTESERKEQPCNTLFFWRGKTLADLNPFYTNIAVFRNPFQSGLGWTVMLLGVFWWQMGISLFMSDVGSLVPPSAVPHTAVVLLGEDILITTVFTLFLTESLKKIDRLRSSQPIKEEQVGVI